MPKLLAFLPCEKIIRDERGGNITLIAVLERVNILLKQPARIEKAVSFPMKWAILSSWQRQPDDEGKTFEETFLLRDASGTTLMGGSASFAFTDMMHHTIYNLDSFPVSPGGGMYQLSMTVAERGSPHGEPITTYPVLVVLSEPSAPESA